ncbi:MAG TPA: hypothetical protein PKM88_16080 [bacterium]|nr:hypothetical protein [bacterium]
MVTQLASFREGIDALEASLAKGLAGATAQLRPAVPAAPAEPLTGELALSAATIAQLTRLAAQAAPRVVVVPVPAGAAAPSVAMPAAQSDAAAVPAAPGGTPPMAQSATVAPAAAPHAVAPAAVPAADQRAAKPGAPPQITGDYRDEFILPLGETRSFPARTYTLTGNNFRAGAHFFVYDKKQPIVVRDGAALTYTPPPNPKMRPCVQIGEVALAFAVVSGQEARLTLELRATANRGLEQPYTEVLPVTIINPDGTYAPYVQLQFLVNPQDSVPAKPKRKAR